MQQYTSGALLAVGFLLLLSCAGEAVVIEPSAQTQSPWSYWCTIRGTRVHFLDTGGVDNDCTLLIVHGYLGSTYPFLDLIDVLAKDLRVVMPDLPAFGASDVPHCTCDMDFYLDFLEEFSQRLGLDYCYLMGTSLGTNIAVHYTEKHPEQIQGLIFLSPFGLHDQAGRMSQARRWDSLLPLASALITKRGVQRRLQRSSYIKEKITPELVETCWKPFTTAAGRRATVEITRDIIGNCSMDEILPHLGQPVLILIGSEDKLISPEDRDKICRLLADERLEIIDKSGHFIYLDAPNVVSKQIVTFTKGGM